MNNSFHALSFPADGFKNTEFLNHHYSYKRFHTLGPLKDIESHAALGRMAWFIHSFPTDRIPLRYF
ncbi:MAG TPA: hypothetical protein VGB38_08070, partial [bacterium]